MQDGRDVIYPLFKILVGVICLILAVEYAYAYCVYQAASFGIMYIGDTLTWFFAGEYYLLKVFRITFGF